MRAAADGVPGRDEGRTQPMRGRGVQRRGRTRRGPAQSPGGLLLGFAPPPRLGPAASAPASRPRAAGLTGRPASPARRPRARSGGRGGRGGPTASAPEPPQPPAPALTASAATAAAAAPRGPGAGPEWRRRQAPPPPLTNGARGPAPGPAPSARLGVRTRLTDRSWAGRRGRARVRARD